MRYVFIIAAFLTACAVGPDYKRPGVDLPTKLPPTSAASKPIEVTWWQQFNDPTLNKMIDTALKKNLDLELALARVDEARANLGIAKSAFYPNLDLRAQAGKAKVSENGPLFIPGANSTYEDYSLGLDLSYELDLWGKIRRSNEAARAELWSADYNRVNVQLTLISSVVSSYMLLRSLDLQLQISKETAKSRTDSFQIMNRRFTGGVTSELSSRQAEAEMYSAIASVAKFQDQVSQAESSLAILLGQAPREIIELQLARGKSLEDLIVPPTLPTYMPSELLERRPDIAAAEQDLIAQNARIGVAKSYYFPSISLIGSYGTESMDMKNLFKGPSQAWSFGLGISLPIFNGGRTGYLVEAATARQKQAVAKYQKTIQVAFTEVRNALKTYDNSKAAVDALKSQVAALEKNIYLANLRYKNGQSPYLEVLDAERALFGVQIDLVRGEQARLISVVDLYKALGGGWNTPDPNGQKKNPPDQALRD